MQHLFLPMKNPTENITIKEIAKIAGVSTGTVDRVLHNRGKVSPKNRKKIDKVLTEVDYHPNIFASTLASNKKYRLAALVPRSIQGDYWELVSKGIDDALEEYRQFGVNIDKIYFEQYNSESIHRIIDENISENYDGVILAVLFYDEFKQVAEILDEKLIPYICMDSNLQIDSQLSFVGTNSLSGGKLSARMLLSLISPLDDILIVLLNAKNGMRSNQSINREKGFLEYIKDKYFNGKIHRINLEIVDKEHNDKILDHFFSKNTVKAVIVFNSTCHIVAQYFKEKGMNNIVLVGYDGIEKNIQMMKEGFVDVLISQRPYFQGYESTKMLCNYLIKKVVPQKVNYIPLDILVPENVEFYQ